MDNKIGLLLVDDDETFRKVFVSTFKDSMFAVHQAGSGEDALELVKKERCEVAVLDIILPGMNGIELLEKLKKLYPDINVVMLSGQGTVQDAAEAIKQGAFDYVEKPFSLFELEKKIIDAYARKNIIAGQSKSGEKSKPMDVAEALVEPDIRILGETPEIDAIRNVVERIADSTSSVIIEGESGTGKDVVARVMHMKSSRNNGPLIAVNCGALPETLLENELFGHEKGAFTDAHTQKRGLFEVAAGGTLFIDEVGEMSGPLQVKLLRVLETGEFRRLGGISLIKTDVRIVAATNRNLSRAMDDGTFRKDLYYRLSVFTIMMPPLRERWRDIPLLIENFLDSSRAKKISPVRKSFSQDSLDTLLSYRWPGNIRELYNVLERAIVLSSDDVISRAALPIYITNKFQDRLIVESNSGLRSLKEVEKEHIERVLRETNFNKNLSSKILRISRQKLYRKIDAYKLEPAKKNGGNK